MKHGPAHLYDRAAQLGVLMARGLMSWDSVQHVCGLWSAPLAHLDASGVRTSLCHAATDAARDHDRRLSLSEWSVRKAVRPLFDVNATTAQIEEAAGSNRGVLDWPDVFPILREELARYLSSRKR